MQHRLEPCDSRDISFKLFMDIFTVMRPFLCNHLGDTGKVGNHGFPRDCMKELSRKTASLRVSYRLTTLIYFLNIKKFEINCEPTLRKHGTSIT